MQPSACLPWQPDHAANAAQEYRAYTTRWGTIMILQRYDCSLIGKEPTTC
jgi:hypothetical protein